MKNLRIMKVANEDLFKVIQENIYSCVTSKIVLDDVKYHHSLNHKNVPIVLKNGLLSYKQKIIITENRELTDHEKNIYSDDCHVNGVDYISLSNMQDDFDQMYRNEVIYDAYGTSEPDIIISKDVVAHKNTINYFNEWLVKDKIPVEMFNCINVRLLKSINQVLLMDKVFQMNNKNNIEAKTLILDYYKCVRDIAITMQQLNIQIPLREASYVTSVDEENIESLTLDKDRIAKLPLITIK